MVFEPFDDAGRPERTQEETRLLSAVGSRQVVPWKEYVTALERSNAKCVVASD